MFCTKCGKPFRDNEKFCTNCGTPRPQVASQPAAPQSTPQPAAPQSTPQPVAPQPKPAGARPAPQPPRPETPRPDRGQPEPKKGKGGPIIGIAVAVVLVIALAAAVFFFMSGRDKSENDEPRQTAETTVEPRETPENVETAEPTPEPVEDYDFSLMAGVYYCAEVPDTSLELSVVGSEMSIFKRTGTTVDIQTVISGPTRPNFTIAYGDRIIEFFYSDSGKSVTLTEDGRTALYTLDGDQFWVEVGPEPEDDAWSYLLPSDTQYITREDLEGFTKEEAVMARNEIFARHGYNFQADNVRMYFEAKAWYMAIPGVDATTFGTEQMNEYEKANLIVIQDYEKEMGWK